MARWVIAGPTGQEGQTALQADQQCSRGGVTDARCRQFDRQREPVEATADGRYGYGVVLVQREVGPNCLRPSGEQAARLGRGELVECPLAMNGRQREWWHWEVVFSGKVQHRAARDDDLQMGTGGKKDADAGRGLEDLLEIVEDQQQAAVPEQYG